VRGIFPALVLLLATSYLRRPGIILYGATSLLSTLAPLWNQDTGLVLWCAWTATLIVREWSEGTCRKIGWHLAIQPLLLLGGVAVFIFYLRMSSGKWPDLHLLFTFQQVFIGLGYYCLPILVPDVWMLVIVIYAVGFATVLILYRRRTVSWRTHALFMISLMGTGSFSYFMGRSAESNLVNTASVVPLLLGLYLSETRVLIALGQLSRLSWVLLLPLTSIQVWWALLFVLAGPQLIEQSAAKLVGSERGFPNTSFENNAAFVLSHTMPRQGIYLLSDQAGFYHYLSNTFSDINLASTDEFIWTKDIDRLVSAIEARQIPKLFVDRNFFETKIYRIEVYNRLEKAIAQSYRAEAKSPGDRITLYVPQ
jgi:hypothetical protein